MNILIVTSATWYIDLTDRVYVRAAARSVGNLGASPGVNDHVLTRPLAASVQVVSHEESAAQ